ncbi:MAG: hypothetical protein V4621_00590 [Pseudomonadota bacterium]
MIIKILYTGWIKDKLGTIEDKIDIRENIFLESLIILLSELSTKHKYILEETGIIFFSQDGRILSLKDGIDSDKPIIVFAPIAGG